MWFALVSLSCFVTVCLGYFNTPGYYCEEMHPQERIKINHLMGMWYAIEIIYHHREDNGYIPKVPSCPVVYISEDRVTTTQPPLIGTHKSGEFSYKTSPGRINNNEYSSVAYENDNTKRQYENYGTVQEHKNKGVSTPKHIYGGQEFTTDFEDGHPDEFKRLIISWNENGNRTEFHVRYNKTKPGFWISSGPETNSHKLAPRFSFFAGTIQVIKAVDDHMVLTFCHSVPHNERYSVLLSRETTLNKTSIYGVHNLLKRKRFNIEDIVRKGCENGAKAGGLSSVIVAAFVISWVWVYSR